MTVAFQGCGRNAHPVFRPQPWLDGPTARKEGGAMRRTEKMVALFVGVTLVIIIAVFSGVYIHDVITGFIDDFNTATSNTI